MTANLVETWDQWDHLFEGSNGPHKIRISPYDPERRVWVVHETGHQVFAFSNDGSELLVTLGEKDVSANDESHFGRPQDVAFMPDGRILVADGLDNSRIVMFDPEGTYITAFGEKGTGRGEFDGVHAVATSADGRIYVADRNNDRIQVFNETTRAAAWYHPNIAPIGVWTDFDFPNDIIINGYNVWVADNDPPKSHPARPERQPRIYVGHRRRGPRSVSRITSVLCRCRWQPLRRRQRDGSDTEVRAESGRQSGERNADAGTATHDAVTADG